MTAFEDINGAIIKPNNRADLMRHPAFANLGTDGDGNPRVWRNEYSCRSCTSEQIDWTDDWSCECDSECPNCGASCSPVGSDWLPTCKAWTIAGAPDDATYHLWASLPEGDAHRSVAEIRGSYPKMAVLDECSALTTITVVVEEAGLPWPLIYTIDVISIADEDAILRQIADIRYSEINDDGEEQDPEILKATLESLTLHFALAGDVKTLVDWRN